MGGEGEGGFDHRARVFQPHRRCSTTLLLLGLFIFLFVFGACSSERRGGEAETLEERAKGFWEVRVAGDDIKAYNYEAYSKTGKMTLQQYIQARNPTLKYIAYEVKRTVEKGDEATVTVNVQYHLVIPAMTDLNLSTTIDERWVRLDGQWYRQLEQSEASKTSG